MPLSLFSLCKCVFHTSKVKKFLVRPYLCVKSVEENIEGDTNLYHLLWNRIQQSKKADAINPIPRVSLDNHHHHILYIRVYKVTYKRYELIHSSKLELKIQLLNVKN